MLGARGQGTLGPFDFVQYEFSTTVRTEVCCTGSVQVTITTGTSLTRDYVVDLDTTEFSITVSSSHAYLIHWMSVPDPTRMVSTNQI